MPANPLNKFRVDTERSRGASKTNKPIIRTINLWLPVIIWMGFIFYLSSIPGSFIPHLFSHQDIVSHIFVYMILAYFFSRALKNTYSSIALSKLIFFTVIFGVIYGLSDEFHQTFTPDRTASVFDLFIDGIGSLLGSLFYR